MRQSDRAKWMKLPTASQRIQAGSNFSNEKKIPVLGMAQRGGKVAAYVVPSTQLATLLPHVQKKVLPSTLVYTDEARYYEKSIPNAGYQHKRIHHGAGVYVDGDVHTNTIEGFWALTKGGIGGVYHAVSKKYLQSYLDEYAFRYNNRRMATGRGMFDAFLARIEKAP